MDGKVLIIDMNISTASRLDLVLADIQGKVKYTILKPQRPNKSLLTLTQTKGLRTNTNRSGQSNPHAKLI